jgi:hypothetical protein
MMDESGNKLSLVDHSAALDKFVFAAKIMGCFVRGHGGGLPPPDPPVEGMIGGKIREKLHSHK